LEVPLGQLEEATKSYQAANKLIADHAPTVMGLRRVLLRQGRFDEALPVFDRGVRLADRPEDKAALLYDKGRVLEDRLKKPAEARAAYEAALELAPLDPGILTAVARSQRAAKAWTKLDRTLERQSQVGDGDVRLRAARIAERARLTEMRASDPSLATELFQRAFDTEARSSGALRDLERLHETHRRYRDLAAALEARVSDSVDPHVRATALYRLARVLGGRLSDWTGAAAALERAFREAPEDTLVLEELGRIYERLEDHAELAGVFERRVERSTDRSTVIDCMMKCARIHEQELGDEARAIGWYERVLSLAPTHIPALQALAKLYVRGNQWAKLVRMHLGEAERATDNLRRAAAYARVAEIQERNLGNREEAMAQHARALGLVPGYDVSFRALSRLYHEAGRHSELVELYERAVELAADEETRFTYLFKIGRLFEDALDAPKHAIFAYRRILKIDERHFGALHALQRAAERSGEWKALVEALAAPYRRASPRGPTAPCWRGE
jgi:tetratricopeptide (TPR) repeat protein